ncbi:MAG: chemotaxis protein CheW [candidate division WOR-3 bacterium]
MKKKKISFKKILSQEKLELPKEKSERIKPERTKFERKFFSEGKLIKKKDKVEEKEVLEPLVKKKIEKKKEEIMIVRIGEEYYGIPLSDVEEIKKDLRLTSTSQSEFLIGIAELRDSIIPVVNSWQILGLKMEGERLKDAFPVVVLRVSNELVGLEVSEIVEIVEIYENEILPLPDVFPPNLFSGGYSYKSKIVGVLNIGNLLKGKQIQSFKEKLDETIK